MNLAYVDTRARSTDGQTSHDAAKHALTRKAAAERIKIVSAIHLHGPMTAREVAQMTGLDYIETQRRISECGLTKTDVRRAGCFVWSA